ncbi:POM121-like protein 2 [Cavia porcellus]|uniref:POM121-like protein 2 n=1 Tax=Cavia porcellus TaxID=10141 RepID=UPI002FE062A2
MGCVLGRPPASSGSPPGHGDPPEGPGARAQPVYRVGRVQQVLRAQHVLRAHAAPRLRPGPGPGPGPAPLSRAAAASEARLRPGLRRGRDPVARAPPSAGWDGFLRRTIWPLRHLGAVHSPVTVRICPREPSGPAAPSSAPVIHCAGPLEPELLAPRDSEGSDLHGECVAARPSAFTPMAKRGALVAFVPRPGPLRASRPAPRAPTRSAACEHPGAPLSGKRNAIFSSYSSTRLGPAPAKRGLPRFSPEPPEWPLKKREKGRAPRPERAASVTARRPGPQRAKTPPLPTRPGDAQLGTTPPERGSDEHRAVEKEAGQDATKAATDSTPEVWTGVRPHPCGNPPFPGTAPTVADPQLGIREKTSPGPPESVGHERSEAPPAHSPGATPGAGNALSAPSLRNAGSALGSDAPVTPSAVPSSQCPLFPMSSGPGLQLPAPAPSAATSESLLKPVSESLPGGQKADSSDPRVSAEAAPLLGASLCAAPHVLTPAFKPICPGSLSPVSTAAAFFPPQPCPPPASAAAYFPDGLVLSPCPARTCQAPAAQPPRDSSRVDPGLRLLQYTGATGCSPGNSLGFPAGQPPSLPAVCGVAVGNQVPRAAQVTSGRSAADSRDAQSPVAASALVCTHPHTLSLSISDLTPASPGVTLQPAFGAEAGQKLGIPQPALTPCFSNPLLSGNWAVAPPAPGPVPPGPGLSLATQVALGTGVHSASTVQVPTHSPAGFAFCHTHPVTGFEGAAQSHQSGVGGPVFGSMAPRPFAFGGSVTPMECGEPRLTASTDRRSTSTSGAPSMGGAVLSGVTKTRITFEKGPGQNLQRPPSQALPSLLGRTSSSVRKPALRVPSTTPFAQSSRLPGPAKLGSGMGSARGSPPFQGAAGKGRDPFRSPACLFSIGANPKSPRSREQGRFQRHHAHRK